jgi:hypothetical protein
MHSNFFVVSSSVTQYLYALVWEVDVSVWCRFVRDLSLLSLNLCTQEGVGGDLGDTFMPLTLLVSILKINIII